MNYGALKSLLASYLHRDDLSSMIPNFILLAQGRMNHDLKRVPMHTTVDLTVTAGDSLVTLPSDMLELKRVRMPKSEGGYNPLLQKTLVQNDQIFQSQNGTVDTPTGYARYGRLLELSPAPSENSTVNVIYRKMFAEFSADTDTDDILTLYPNVYIYAAMAEAMPFLEDKNKDWMALYKDEVAMLNDIYEEDEWSGAPLQIISLGNDTP